MKQYRYIALLVMLFSFSIAQIAHADLTIKMHMTMSGKDFSKMTAAQKAKMEKMLNYVSYYTSDKSRTDSFMMISIVDKKLKKMYMLNTNTKTYSEMPFTQNPNDMFSVASALTKDQSKIVDTKQTVVILGHKAHRYKISLNMKLQTMKMVVYTAQDFPAEDLKIFQSQNSVLSGVPLKMIIAMPGKNSPVTSMTITATSINMAPINPNLFELPSGYTKEKLEDLYGKAEEKKLLETGAPAPDFTAYTKDGKPVKLSDYRGKAVMIDFWSTWCGPCQMSLPHTQGLAKKYKAQGLVVLGVNVWDSKSEFTKWLPKHAAYKDINFVIDLNAQPNDIASKLYNVSGIPTVYVIGKDGKVVASQVGYDEENPAVENGIKSALR